MNKEADTASEMIKRLALSLDSIFQRAEELNASFERSPTECVNDFETPSTPF